MEQNERYNHYYSEEKNKEFQYSRQCNYKFFYGDLPENPSSDELARDWNLNGVELVFISKFKIENRAWAAFSLCLLRKYSRFPKPNEKPSSTISMWLNKILKLPIKESTIFPERDKTRTEILDSIKSFLGYEDFDEKVVQDLKSWAFQHACAGDSEAHVREQIIPLLKKWLVILPAESSLEKAFCSIWEEVKEKVYENIYSKLSDDIKSKINNLLYVDSNSKSKKSALFSFKQPPPEPKPSAIQEWIEKYNLLKDFDTSTIDLTSISPQLAKEFDRDAQQYDVHALKELKEEKRYTLVACFLIESQSRILDQIVQMNDMCLTNFERSCRNEFYKSLTSKTKYYQKSKKTLLEYSEKSIRLIRDKKADQIEEQLDIDSVLAAIGDIKELSNYEDRGFLIECLNRHNQLNKYMQLFFNLPIEAQKGSEDIILALNMVRYRVENRSKGLLPDTPSQFLKSPWKQMFESSLPNERLRAWEIGLLFEIKERLKSGDLFIRGSSKYRPFWEMIFTDEEWKQRREKGFKNLKISEDFSIIRNELVKQYEETYNHFLKTLPENKFVKVINNKFIFSRDLGTKEDPEVDVIRKAIEHSLPANKSIENIFESVDNHCHFINFIISKTRNASKWEKKKHVVLAALLSQATNIGMSGMVRSTDGISVHELSDCIRECFTPQILRELNQFLVEFILKLSYSKNYGDGTCSSSDGQRFAVREGSLYTSFCTRYFGFYKKAVNVYTHIADNYSVFSTQILSCGIREAIAVLDGLLSSENFIQSKIHTTDTHGYTDQIFSISYLLGITYAPRLKDLGGVKLFRILPKQDLGDYSINFIGLANIDSIAPHWDDMIRLVSALKEGHVRACDILPKLGKGSYIDKLSQAFTTLGQIVKTIFLLRYSSDPEFRKIIRRQLNKGEHRHTLADHVFFANKGEFRYGDLESLMCQASCLSIVCNIILISNSIDYDVIIHQLKSVGFPIKDELLGHISPLAYKHIAINGHYKFSREEETMII